MAGGNFDNEIKGALSQKQPDPKVATPSSGAGKRPPPMAAKQHNPDAVASKPPEPHQFQSPQGQAPGQTGLGQAPDQLGGHMMPHNNALPQSSGLQQAHSQIVNALAQRDMLRGH